MSTKLRYFSRIRAGMRRVAHGFTLIELMITIAIAAILLTIAVPSFNDALLGGKLTSFANSLVASAHVARGEAIKRNTVVTMCTSANGSTCASSGSWDQGWIVLSGTTVILHQQILPTGFKVLAGSSSLAFQPTGVGTTAASFTVCRSGPTVGAQERVVTVSATGRTSVVRTAVGSCS